MAEDTTADNNAPLQPNNETTENKPTQGPPEGHPRWEEVIAEKNELKGTVAELTQKLQDLTTRVEQRQDRDGGDDLTAEEQATLDRIDGALRKQKGYVTREELETERRHNTLAGNLRDLASDVKQMNGLPSFKPDDVLVYAKKNGFGESKAALMAAYKDMHADAWDEYNYKQRGAAPTPPTSEKPTGGDRAVEDDKELTPQKIDKMDINEYSQKSGDILAQMKARAREADRR